MNTAIIPEGKYIVSYTGYKLKEDKNGQPYYMLMLKITDDNHCDAGLHNRLVFDSFFLNREDKHNMQKQKLKSFLLAIRFMEIGDIVEIDKFNFGTLKLLEDEKLRVNLVHYTNKEGKVFVNVKSYLRNFADKQEERNYFNDYDLYMKDPVNFAEHKKQKANTETNNSDDFFVLDDEVPF